MSRWAQDPEAAADALILRSLDDIGVAGRVLLVNQSGALPGAVRQRGAAATVWNRRLVEGLPAAPWPPVGPAQGPREEPFALALVRLPKAREEQAMTVHAALSVLAPGGRLILYGGNDEGIRPAAAMLGRVAADVTTLATRGHGRVLSTRRPDGIEGLRGSLEAWRQVAKLEIGGAARDWVSYPGCFAAGRIDEGTALLLSVLPRLAPGAEVLDYACGTGVIAAALLAAQGDLKVEAMDNDAVALTAAGENVPAARSILGVRLADASGRRYDAILSNPPLHRGIAEDRTLLERLIGEAPSHLAPGGCLQLVVQRRVPLDRLLAEHFAKAETVAESGRYWVWRAWHSEARDRRAQ